MTKLGYVLVSLGFLAGSLAAVWGTEGNEWPLWVGGMVVGVVGVVAARIGSKRVSQSEGRIAADLGTLEESLERLSANLGEIVARRDEIDVYDLRHRLDEKLPEDLSAFAEARESIGHRYGLQAYADIMSHFAATERYLNRVWCCSADGYIDECHDYLGRAAEQLAEVQRRWRELGGAAA